MDPQEELALVRSCRASNYQDFAKLYDHYAQPIFRFIHYRVRDRMLAEDLTSQTFLKAMEKLHTFDVERGMFGAWLYRIARNTVIDHVRTVKPVTPIDENFDMAGDEDATLRAKRGIDAKQVQAMLASLDDEKRELLQLRLWDGLSYKEIAEVTGKSEANCKVIVSRTLSQLRKDFPVSSLVLLLLFPFLS